MKTVGWTVDLGRALGKMISLGTMQGSPQSCLNVRWHCEKLPNYYEREGQRGSSCDHVDKKLNKNGSARPIKYDNTTI